MPTETFMTISYMCTISKRLGTCAPCRSKKKRKNSKIRPFNSRIRFSPVIIVTR